MRFSAMLADEYRLIVRSLIICSPGWTIKAKRQNIILAALTLSGIGSRLKNNRISARQKALNVGCNFYAALTSMHIISFFCPDSSVWTDWKDHVG